MNHEKLYGQIKGIMELNHHAHLMSFMKRTPTPISSNNGERFAAKKEQQP
jgi:hypothetical protein